MSRVQQQLQERLLRLDSARFERLIAHLLARLGYVEVKVLRAEMPGGRRSHKGRTRHGGMDLMAYSQTDLSRALAVVQVKQYRRPVARQFVDGLRGAMLRTEAREGLLITTGPFSRVARTAAASDHIAPLRLVDGAELLNLLVIHQVGVRRTRKGSYRLDRRFFRRLQAGQSLHSRHLFDGLSPAKHGSSQKESERINIETRTNPTQGGGMT
ncbi:MAG: restriction endonuclease, partial [Armatimonadota bacterium]|nr:restriction endonuclease [Armatimonadota bacterium]